MVLSACLLCFSSTVNAANAMKNPSFESPVVPLGNNYPATVSDWSTTGGSLGANLVRVNGSGYPGGPNTAEEGSQYLDIVNAAGTAFQNFTLDTGNWTVKFGAWFSNREPHSGSNYTSTLGIYDSGGTNLLSPLVTVDLSTDSKPSTNWTEGQGSVSLNAGTYRFQVNLNDANNVDSGYVEASTCRILSLKSNGVVSPPGSVLYGTGAYIATFNGTTYDLVIKTNEGDFTNRGLIYNDGQFPVSSGCSGAAEQCFPFQNMVSTPSSATDLTGLVVGTAMGPTGDQISFGNGTYTYTGSKFQNGHGGTFTTRDCATVPEPGTLLLMLLPLAGLRAIRRHRQPA